MKKKSKRIRNSEEYTQVLSALRESANKALNYKQVASKVKLIDKKEVAQILELLVRHGEIEKIGRGQFRYVKNRSEIQGILDFNSRGDAYLVSEDLDDDIKLKNGQTKDAFDGDEVLVRIDFKPSTNKQKAYVHQVIKRARTEFVGTVEKYGNNVFVRPDNHKIHTDFYIPEERSKGVKHGMKVVFSFRDWPKKAKNPYGTILKILGAAGEHQTEMHAIIAEFGFDTEFPNTRGSRSFILG